MIFFNQIIKKNALLCSKSYNSSLELSIGSIRGSFFWDTLYILKPNTNLSPDHRLYKWPDNT